MKTSCCITQKNICISRLCCCNCIINYRSRICTGLSANDLHSCTVCPLCQLLTCCCTEGIRSCQDHLLALILQLARKLAYRSSLSHTVDTDHKDHGLTVLKLIFCAVHTHLLLYFIDQKLFAFHWLLNVLFCNFFFQIFYNRSSGINTNISHDQDFLQFLIEILVNTGKATENIVKAGNDIISGLGQSADQSFEKAFLLFCHNTPPVTG